MKKAETSGHEVRDINIRSVLLFGVGLLALLALSFYLMKGTFDLLVRREAASQPPAPSLVQEKPLPPPQPQFQMYPRQQLQQKRVAEAELLSSYGWVDREAGIVRIPIRRAMEQVVEQGLPSREAITGETEP